MATRTEEYGQVEQVRHPLVTVRGLPGARLGELVQFGGGITGQVFSLDVETIDVVVFGSQPRLVGESVTRVGKTLTVELSQAILGSVISPFCRELMTKPAKKSAATTGLSPQSLEIDIAPPTLEKRQRITQPLETGVSLVDLVLPLGKGQRELIVGDRKTGKTTFALQLAEHQVHAGAHIVYAAIGKLASEVKRLQEEFERKGIADSVTMVATVANDPPSVIYQTPFSALTVAEYLVQAGHDVVVVLDDLSTHARYYREVALVGKRFPGRDSYPGDVFYTHARLLERAGCFVHPQKSETGVSLSCLPIVETTDSEVTDYIVSNLISITDGHLLFDTSLFSQGHRPAIHPGLSVTRVGKQTQTPLLRDLAHTLTLFINQYQKILDVTHFGAELTIKTQALLSRGAALFAFLEQSKDQTFDSPVKVVICGAVLLDWFNEISPLEIQAARDTLQKKYRSNIGVKKSLDDLIAHSESMTTFSAALTKAQEELTTLWQQ